MKLLLSRAKPHPKRAAPPIRGHNSLSLYPGTGQGPPNGRFFSWPPPPLKKKNACAGTSPPPRQQFLKPMRAAGQPEGPAEAASQGPPQTPKAQPWLPMPGPAQSTGEAQLPGTRSAAHAARLGHPATRPNRPSKCTARPRRGAARQTTCAARWAQRRLGAAQLRRSPTKEPRRSPLGSAPARRAR